MEASQKQWRESLAAWNLVDEDAASIFEAFFEESGGDARKLCASWKPPQGIYGKVAAKVLDQNQEFHRWILYSIWTEDKFEMRDRWVKKKQSLGKTGTRFKPLKISIDAQKICWCHTGEHDESDPAAVECDRCHNWFHVLCVGLTEEQAVNLEEFVCQNCTGTPKLPQVLRRFRPQGSHDPSSKKDASPSELFAAAGADRTPTEAANEQVSSVVSHRTSPAHSVGSELAGIVGEEGHALMGNDPPASISSVCKKVSKTPTAVLDVRNLSPKMTPPSGRGRGRMTPRNLGIEISGAMHEPISLVSTHAASSTFIQEQRELTTAFRDALRRDRKSQAQPQQQPAVSNPDDIIAIPTSSGSPRMTQQHSQKIICEDPDLEHIDFNEDVFSDSAVHETHGNIGASIIRGITAKTGSHSSGLEEVNQQRPSQETLQSTSIPEAVELISTPDEQGGLKLTGKPISRHQREFQQGKQLPATISPSKITEVPIRATTPKNPRKQNNDNEDGRHHDDNQHCAPTSGNARTKKKAESGTLDVGGNQEKEYVTVGYEIPECFDFLLPIKEFEACVNINKSTRPWKYTRPTHSHHTQILAEHFSQFNKLCPLSFYKKDVREPHANSRAALYQAWAKCANRTCDAAYNFRIISPPGEGEDSVKVLVRKTRGTIRHEEGSTASRHFSGAVRATGQEKLQYIAPSKFRMEQAQDPAASEMYRLGNLSKVKPLKVYQQAKVETLRRQDMDRDVLIDLMKTAALLEEVFDSRFLPGYIQLISTIPAAIVMFTFLQLHTLYTSTQKVDVVLFLDATGGICKELPPPFRAKQVYYYVMVIKTKSGESAIPLLEFYSGSHGSEDLYYCLSRFMNQYRRLCTARGRRRLGISRIEIDFSKALLSSSIKMLNYVRTEDVLEYLWLASTQSATTVEAPVIPVHICSIHVRRFFSRALDRFFGKNHNDLRYTTYRTWLNYFLRVKDIGSLYRRMEEILTFTGMEYETDDVFTMRSGIGEPVVYTGPAPWMNIPSQVDGSVPFYKRSKFGFLASILSEKIQRANLTAIDQVNQGRQLQQNVLYNKRMHTYLLQTFLPFAPILSEMVLRIFNQPLVDTNTNPVEYWMKKLKVDYLGRQHNIKISRLVRLNAELIQGHFNLQPIQPTSDEDESSEDDEVPEEYGLDISEEDEEVIRNALSPEKHEEVWQKRVGDTHAVRRPTSDLTTGMPLIPWSFFYSVRNQQIEGTNTCPLDTFLQILYFLRFYDRDGSAFFGEHKETAICLKLKEIFDMIHFQQFGKARLFWYTEVMQKQLLTYINFWGTEEGICFKYMTGLFGLVSESVVCENQDCAVSPRIHDTFPLTEIDCVNMQQFISYMNQGKEQVCKGCHTPLNSIFEIENLEGLKILLVRLQPWFGDVNNGKESELPPTFMIGTCKFQVRAYSMLTRTAHFYAVLLFEGKKYTYDGKVDEKLKIRSEKEIQESQDGVSSVYAIRIE